MPSYDDENFFDISNNRSRSDGMRFCVISRHTSVSGFCLYQPTIKRYITAVGLLDEDDMAYFERLESDWRNSLPTFSFSWIMATFPEATVIAKKYIYAEVRELIAKINALDLEKTVARVEISKAPFYKQAEMNAELEERMEYWHEKYLLRLKKLRSQLYSLKVKEGLVEASKTKITDEDIARAKEYPITLLLTFNRMHLTRCPFHNDRHPSLRVYEDNHAYCYSGCGKKDSIDIYMELNKVTWNDAVRFLSKK